LRRTAPTPPGPRPACRARARGRWPIRCAGSRTERWPPPPRGRPPCWPPGPGTGSGSPGSGGHADMSPQATLAREYTPRMATQASVRRRLEPAVFRLPVERLRRGYYSDAYFVYTKQLLEAENYHPRVTMQAFQKQDSLLGGIDEAIAVLKL